MDKNKRGGEKKKCTCGGGRYIDGKLDVYYHPNPACPMNILKDSQKEWEKEFDKEFGGAFFIDDAGYDTMPHDEKGNVLGNDRGLKDDLKTSQIKSFIRSLLHQERKRVVSLVEEIIGRSPNNLDMIITKKDWNRLKIKLEKVKLS